MAESFVHESQTDDDDGDDDDNGKLSMFLLSVAGIFPLML